jgi:hypothetical protein
VHPELRSHWYLPPVGWVTAQTPGWAHVALTAAVALITWRTKVHALLLISAGAIAGVLGWL